MEVYEPREDSYLLQEFVREHAFGRVLDVGTGSGIQALTAAESVKVREVIAIDINETAIEELKQKVKLIKKVKPRQSDLFSEVEGQFDTIIFNPPYLPQDKVGNEIIEDPSLYGGKKGWEISERFFNEVSKHLVPGGKILFLFSTLTNKKKIEEMIENNLLKFEEVGSKKLAFEELFVYLVEKGKVLRNLEINYVENIKYFTHGKRGNIFTGIIDRNKFVKTHLSSKKDLMKVAIKVKRKESTAVERIDNEIRWLKILNKKGIGPRLLFYGENYLVYEFVEGEFILDWLKDKRKEQIEMVLINVLRQCFIMDELKVNKEEMHRPHKHILISDFGGVVLLDFERCIKSDKPKNVTQVVEFFSRISKELWEKGFEVKVSELRELAKEYKKDLSKESFERIVKYIS
jgi:release factor glutamine methyltransferase